MGNGQYRSVNVGREKCNNAVHKITLTIIIIGIDTLIKTALLYFWLFIESGLNGLQFTNIHKIVFVH